MYTYLYLPNNKAHNVVVLMLGAFISWIYVDTRELSQDTAMYRNILMFWMNGVPSLVGVFLVLVSNEHYHILRNEAKNGLANPLLVVAINTVVQIPIVVAASSVIMSVGGYAIGNWPGASFPMVVLCVTSLVLAYDSFAELLGVLFRSPVVGVLCFLILFILSMSFSGIFIYPEDIVWPFRLFAYILPLVYVLEASTFHVFQDYTFSDADLCSDVTNSTCLFHLDASGAPMLPGWTCPEVREWILSMCSSRMPEYNVFLSHDVCMMRAHRFYLDNPALERPACKCCAPLASFIPFSRIRTTRSRTFALSSA